MQGGFDVFSDAFAQQNMKMEIQRKMPDGSYIPASEAQVDALKTQARMTTFADALKHMTLEEKTACALEMKNAANQLYEDQEYMEATQCYLQALTAASFGSGVSLGADGDIKVEQDGSDDRVVEVDDKNERVVDVDALQQRKDNIDELVVPCLNNLIACCIALQEYGKALQFASQVLKLRPNNTRTQLRMGRCLVELGKYAEAIATLERAIETELERDIDSPGLKQSATSAYAKIYLDRAKRGQVRERENMKRRKDGMRRAFHVKSEKGQSSEVSEQDGDTSDSLRPPPPGLGKGDFDFLHSTQRVDGLSIALVLCALVYVGMFVYKKYFS